VVINMKSKSSLSGLLLLLTLAPFRMPAQTSVPPPDFDRPVSWKLMLPNIGSDQKKIWLFPAKLTHRKYLIPTLAFLGATAALIALDPHDAPPFRNTTAFNGFNNVFTGNVTVYGTIAVPAVLYVTSFAIKDLKMRNTALLAAEAVGDSEILATVLKDATRRVRPAAIGAGQSYSDTWFESSGSFLRGNGSFPSGHAIAAFSVATVVARRYRNRKWVPYVAYGLAGAVAFSRLTLSAHFVSDVFVGGVLGYSISRFAVLRE
jgi:membrane-associated phospholipid phosphatase